jgi:hypothetical protein
MPDDGPKQGRVPMAELVSQFASMNEGPLSTHRRAVCEQRLRRIVEAAGTFNLKWIESPAGA